MSSPRHNASSSPLDLESISNGFHSLSIIDIPKFEQFPQITSPKVNDSSPPNHTDLPKANTGKSKMPTSIKPFRGVQDNLEDPDEYIEGLEWIYSQDYQSAEPSQSLDAKLTYVNKTFRILFRNHLEGKAVEWYSNLAPPIRKDWDSLKTSFLDHFKLISRDSQTNLWEKKVELANLRQGTHEGIAQFMKRAEDLADQIPNSEVDVGMAIIQGMSDENEKKRISFECHKDSDFTFKKVKKLIRAAFFEVGKTSLFDSKHQQPSNPASQSSSSDKALRQMVISASTSLPSILQGMRSIGIALQNLNRVPISAQPVQGGAQKQYKTSRDLRDIKCYICGEMGHYASAHSDLKLQQPRVSGTLFPKDTSRSGDPVVQGKLVTMVQEEDENIMLAAPVPSRDSGVEKRLQKKAITQVVSQRQLRPIYEDSQAHESNDRTSKVIDELKDIRVPDKIQHVAPSVPQKSPQVFQNPDLMQLPGLKMSHLIEGMTQLHVENNDIISMKVTPSITEEAFVDPFPRDLESSFLEEDAISTGYAIKDKNTLKQKSNLIEDTKWPVLVDLGSRAEVLGPVKDSVLVEDISMPVKGTDYAEVSTSSIRTVFTIPDAIEVLGLGGGTGGSIKIIGRLDDLSMKPLQKELSERSLDSIFRSIYDPYDPGSRGSGHFCQVQESNDGMQTNQNVRRIQCKQRPEDPGGILPLKHRAAGFSGEWGQGSTTRYRDHTSGDRRTRRGRTRSQSSHSAIKMKKKKGGGQKRNEKPGVSMTEWEQVV